MLALIDVGLLFIGLVLGIFWFSCVLLPLLYGIPRATWWALNGRVRWRVIPRYFVGAAFWFLVSFVAVFLLAKFLPNAFWYLYSSPAFNLGQAIGILICFIRMVGAKSAKDALNQDFFHYVWQNLTPSGKRMLEERGVDVGDIITASTDKFRVWSFIYVVVYWLKRLVLLLFGWLSFALLVALVLAVFGWAAWTWVWYVLTSLVGLFILHTLILISGFVVGPRVQREQASQTDRELQ